MKYAYKKNHSAINHIAVVISVLCIILLVIMFALDRQQRNALQESLAQLAHQQNQEEQAFLNMVNAEYESDKAIFEQYLPGIVCWGDSLTAGAGGNGVTYPKVLQALINEHICDQYVLKSHINSKYTYMMSDSNYRLDIPVINMGVGGETSITIVGRNGAIPYVLSESVTIPGDTTPVNIHFTSSTGQLVSPLRQQHSGVNPVIIGGIEGTLSIIQNTWESKDYSYTFTRSTAGEIKTFQPGTQIHTAASQQYLDYITVIFIGTNGGYTSYEDLIQQQRAIIGHQSANNDRFIIVGLHTGTAQTRSNLEEAMEEEYGAKYINLREYLSTQGLEDAQITPTEEDIELMLQGATPYSLMVDDHLHFNAAAYELIGNLIFNTMDDLGYFDEVRNAINHNFE